MSNEIVFEVNIPTDENGFVLLKCPLCGELFKLQSSDYQDDSVFKIYCPACGLISDNYVTDDVLELAMAMAENYANDLIMRELKKLEKESHGLFRLDNSSKPRKKSELPIKLTVEALEKKTFECCNKEIMLKPILKMSCSYCPYCGVMDYGID